MGAWILTVAGVNINMRYLSKRQKLQYKLRISHGISVADSQQQSSLFLSLLILAIKKKPSAVNCGDIFFPYI